MSFPARLSPCAFAIVLLAGVATVSSDDFAAENEIDPQKAAIRTWMKDYARSTRIACLDESGQPDERAPIELVPEPVFRFADEYHEVPDATLWVWTREGRPLAFQKIEANAWAGNSDWSIIFASVAQQPLCVEWQGGKTFHHNGTGAIFRPFPDGDPPAEGSRRREMQLRELKGRFRGRISPRGDADNAALRILPTPIYRYSERDTKRPLGAVYGVTVTGTNPNLLLVIEARPDERAVERWHYAFARMSGTSGEIRLDDEIVWKFAAETSGSLEDRAWTSFFLPRTLPLPQRQDN